MLIAHVFSTQAKRHLDKQQTQDVPGDHDPSSNDEHLNLNNSRITIISATPTQFLSSLSSQTKSPFIVLYTKVV